MIPDDRSRRLAALQQQVAFHQEARRKIQTDPALTADMRAILVDYHDAIIRWLQD